jgi:fumarate reductase flavoprotein subunit
MKKSTVSDIQADVVVIGAGVAGLSAALTAQENGAKKVLVLEARSAPGGNSMFAEGFFAIDYKIHSPQEIKNLTLRLLQKSMNYTHHRIDYGLVGKLINESIDSLRWLEARGLKFEWHDIFHGGEVPLYASEIKAKRKTGAAVIKVLVKECQDKSIQILSRTRARKLLMDEKGCVAGVSAESGDQTLKILSGSVVIASGGFGGNKDLLKRYVPTYSEAITLAGMPTQGDGLLMAAEAGADTQDEIVLEMEGPAFPWTRELSLAVTAHHNTIWVNKNGRRFAEEVFNPFECSNSVNRQPGKVSFTLMDEDIKNSIVREEIDHVGAPVKSEDSALDSKLDKMIRSHAEKDRIKIADNWDEIAKWAGIPPKALKATIKEYNSFCDRGHDEQFNKDPEYLLPLRSPPYYAIFCNPTILVTHGGIKIDLNMSVIDENAKPIAGLYAAGVDTGGADADTYNYNLPGHSFGFALSTGRLAGKSAAQYAAKTRL